MSSEIIDTTPAYNNQQQQGWKGRRDRLLRYDFGESSTAMMEVVSLVSMCQVKEIYQRFPIFA